MIPKLPDITVLPGGRKVRTDLRPYADEVVIQASVVTEPEPEEEESDDPTGEPEVKPKAKPKKAEADE